MTIGRHVRRLLVLMLFTPLAAAAQTPSLPAQPVTLDGATSHVYKTIGGHELRLQVFSPAAPVTVRKPAIVFFFGGAFPAVGRPGARGISNPPSGRRPAADAHPSRKGRHDGAVRGR